jgi:hypothetical protein
MSQSVKFTGAHPRTIVRLALEIPAQGKPASSICVDNMKFADQHLILNLFAASAQAWLACNPTANLCDLEKFLRNNNMNSHLIAVPRPKYDPFQLGLRNRGDGAYEYRCLFSCRPPPEAMEELLTHSSSYEENFEKLKKTGMIHIESIDDMTFVDINQFSQLDLKEYRMLSYISRNERVIRIIVVE